MVEPVELSCSSEPVKGYIKRQTPFAAATLLLINASFCNAVGRARQAMRKNVDGKRHYA